MIDTQLIMIEGLPSTGKTTNARFVHIQLERNSINSKWIHEVAMPHPLLFFDEMGLTYDEYDKFLKTYPESADILNKIAVFKKSTVGIHLPEIQWNYLGKISESVYQALLEFDVWKFPLDIYQKFALEKWSHFTQKVLETRDEVYIIDSAIFQFQIFTFLFQNRSYKELQSFINQIIEIIQPLNPCLLYLYRDNTEATIDYLEQDRGTSYLDYLWNRDKDQPYYKGRPHGAERMLSFINVNRIPSPHTFPQNGVYKNEALGFVISVEGLSMIDPTGQARKLFPKSHNEFYVDWLPTVLRFEDSKIIISGSQICERWTTTGMVYQKPPNL